MVSQLKLSRPAGGWINAAFTAFKNTAKPIKYGDTNLVWPPAKVGAGMVQAFFAVVNNVSVTPAELHLRTDTPQQAFSLTIINQGSTEVTYTLGHQPAVTLSLYKSWYNKAFDPEAPTAIVSGLERTVRVPAKGSRVIRVSVGGTGGEEGSCNAAQQQWWLEQTASCYRIPSHPAFFLRHCGAYALLQSSGSATHSILRAPGSTGVSLLTCVCCCCCCCVDTAWPHHSP